jgi:hypothetical protein
LHYLPEAARQALLNMEPANYEYQSEFAKRYVAQGLEKGKAELVIKQLTLKFGAVSETNKARLYSMHSDELDAVGERVLTAQSLVEAMN